MKAEPRHYPAADQRADDANGDVADQTKSGTVDDFTGEPARNETDKQNNEETFARHMHWPTLSLHRTTGKSAFMSPSNNRHGNNLFQPSSLCFAADHYMRTFGLLRKCLSFAPVRGAIAAVASRGQNDLPSTLRSGLQHVFLSAGQPRRRRGPDHRSRPGEGRPL